jgi:uncharacterized protein (DUF1697 family)
MAAIVCMLRGVNVGGNNLIKMEVLRALCASLKLQNAQTYVQSGNVVFATAERDLDRLADRIEAAIEKTAGFRPTVILRTAAEMRDIVERNPFAGRSGLEPGKLIVAFLANDPGQEARERLGAVKADPEEYHFGGRELYVYYPNGMGRSKFTAAVIERTLKTGATARNWNTVTKLLDMAGALE